MTDPLFERESGQSISYKTGGSQHDLVPPVSLSLDRIIRAVSSPEGFLDVVFPVRPTKITFSQIEQLLDVWVETYALVGGRDLTRLLFLLERYPREIEWDLRQHLGVDVGELWRERRWRQLLSYVDMLPQNTRYHQAVMTDPEHVDRLVEAYAEAGQETSGTQKPVAPPLSTWSPEVDKLASVIDAVNRVSWTVAAVNAEKAPAEPDPVPRPDSEIVKRVKFLQWKKANVRHQSRARRLVPHRYENED